MSYQIIPQHYRDLINNQYPQINDEHKKQLGELWRVCLKLVVLNKQDLNSMLFYNNKLKM